MLNDRQNSSSTQGADSDDVDVIGKDLVHDSRDGSTEASVSGSSGMNTVSRRLMRYVGMERVDEDTDDDSAIVNDDSASDDQQLKHHHRSMIQHH